jgi:acyl carrier protein
MGKMDRKEKVARILQGIIKSEINIIPEQKLLEDLGMDSLKIMDLISVLEDEFNIIIPMNRTVNIRTVGDIYSELDNFIKKE